MKYQIVVHGEIFDYAKPRDLTRIVKNLLSCGHGANEIMIYIVLNGKVKMTD